MGKVISNTSFNFRELSAGEGHKENERYGEFVTEDKELLDTFAREFCQNLYDATRDNEVGKATFRILEKNEYDHKYLTKQVKSLEKPLDKKISELNTRVLVIEEEGTTGLRGSIDISDSNSDHNNFWLNSGRRIGRGKLANIKKSGSAGKGNITYFSASEAKTIFAYTNREDSLSHKEYIMGKCELRTSFEEKNGNSVKRRNFEGFYCDVNKTNGALIPLDGKTEINEFRKAFNLQRKNTQLGTSFVIPFIKEEFTEQELIKSIIREYFFLILKGEIEVTVGQETLNRGSIEDIANQYLEDGQEFREFLMNVETISPSDVIKVDKDWSEKLDDESFSDKAALKDIKQKFAEDKLICIEIPIELTNKDNSKHAGSFELYLQKGSTHEDSRVMRSGIPITQEPFRASKVNVPFLSLLYVGADEIGNFCKAAETPNHLRFDTQMESLTELYKNTSPLAKIRSASAIFGHYFLGIEDELNKDKLASILSVKILTPLKPKKKKRTKKKSIKKKKRYTPTIRHDYFTMSSGNGWRMDPGTDLINSFPFNITIEFSIAQVDTPHNKRIKEATYDPNDFDLGDGSADWIINSNDIKIVSKTFNRLEVEITGADYWIDLQHPVFDENSMHANIIWS